MLDRLSHILHRWTELSVTGGPTDRDLADLGLSRDQATRLAHLPHAVPERMIAMASIFGLSADEIERKRADWIELAENCAGCRQRRKCREALADTTHRQTADMGFCPNAPHYADLALRVHA